MSANVDLARASFEIYEKGRGSSIEMTQETFGVYTFRDGKVSKIQYFTDRETALAAAGLTADQQQEAT